MAHFAQLDDNNVVTQVIVINNAELLDANGAESEESGAQFCHSLFGGKWVQTSYNGQFRGTFAGVGYLYDTDKDTFVAPITFSLDPASSASPPPLPSGNVSI